MAFFFLSKKLCTRASCEALPSLVKYAGTYKSGALPASSKSRFPSTFPPCWEILYSNRRQLPPPDVRSRRTSRRDFSTLQSDKPRWRLTKVVWLFPPTSKAWKYASGSAGRQWETASETNTRNCSYPKNRAATRWHADTSNESCPMNI